MGHAQLAPSAASRWMACPGSVRKIEALGEEERTSIHAAEGTAAHWVRQQCLAFGFDPYDFLGTKIQADGYTFEVTEEMADHLQGGIDRALEFDGETIVEVKVDLTPWVGLDKHGRRQGGTVDYAVTSPVYYVLDEWVLSDLKFGAGVPVSPVRNKQQMLYGLGLLNHFGVLDKPEKRPRRLRIIIDQPRHSDGGGEWVVSIEELLAFGKEVQKAAAATRDPDAPCIPSEAACQWCPLARMDGVCPEHEAWKLDMLGLEFDDLDADDEPELPDLDGITPERRRYINQHANIIIKWLKRLHADELAALMTDGPANGVKAVAGGRKPPRKHHDEEASEAWLRKRGLSAEQIFNQKLISVAQLDKLLGKGVFPKTLVDQGDPKPAIVPIEDERPAIISDTEFENFDAEDDFTDI